MKGETSGLIAKEKNLSLKAVELVEAAVKLSSEVKRNKQVCDARKEDKIIADARAQGFDPASELPPNEREDAEQSEIS